MNKGYKEGTRGEERPTTGRRLERFLMPVTLLLFNFIVLLTMLRYIGGILLHKHMHQVWFIGGVKACAPRGKAEKSTAIT